MPYRDYVKAQSLQNPSLLILHQFLSNPGSRHGGCTIIAMDFREGMDHPITRPALATVDLSSELWERLFWMTHDKEDDHNLNHPLQGRILIIEDLTSGVIEILGSELAIDPLFFALHLHTAQKNGMQSQTPCEGTLPSRLLSQDYINISYHRTITSKEIDDSRRRLLRDTIIDRKLVFLPSTTVGLAQHCASVIQIKQESGRWIALILVDPPISNTYILDDWKNGGRRKVQLQSQPFLGEYEDFLDPPPFSKDLEYSEVPPRNGMSQDLVQYWKRRIPACFDARNPSLESLAYYPLRIVAAEWVKYAAAMHYCLIEYEYGRNGAPELERLNTILGELQCWRRRSMFSQQKIQSVIRMLKPRIALDSGNDNSSIQSLIGDYEHVSAKIHEFDRRLESMQPLVTSLVQIVDARRSFAETANITRLTVLALVFVPLSYVSSLFSMNPNNLPGSPDFWVYVAVAIPLTLFVITIACPPVIQIREVVARLNSLRSRDDWARERMA